MIICLINCEFFSTSSNTIPSSLKYGKDAKTINNLLDQEDDGTLSAPELPSTEKLKRGKIKYHLMLNLFEVLNKFLK